MESKQMTLRSQTVQCPHCGEYYSVTYKYCPFCDAGRKAEARKKAARKQQAASLFTGLFSGKDETEGMDAPVGAAQEPRRHREPARQRTEEVAGHGAAEHRPKRRPAPAAADIPRSEGFRKKKTSEMTEEEKKAYRAEREARALARKRERDRAARAAALVDVSSPAQGTLAQEDTIDQQPAETAVPVASPAGMETVEIAIDPMNVAPADILAAVEAAPEKIDPNAAAQEALQDLQTEEAGDQMEAAPVAAETIPAEAEPQPVQVEVPAPVPEVTPRPIDPASILQGDSELDDLLSEIRGMLGEGETVEPAPAPASQTPAGEAPAAPAEPQQAGSEPVSPAEAAAPATEETPAAEAAVPASEASAAEAAAGAPEAAAAEAPAAAPQAAAFPQEDPELIWSPETTAAVEAAAMRKTEPAPVRTRTRQPAPSQERKKPGKRTGPALAPVIAAIIVVALAALLVAKVIAPAIREPVPAESLVLDQAEVLLDSPEATATLTPIFEPKNSVAEVQWSCNNWSVVDVNPYGKLTPQSVGTALVTATLPNGDQASCEVTCSWDETQYPPAEAAATEEAAAEVAAAPGLSTTDLTLNSQGMTQQLTLNGVTGAVTWSSSKPSVVTVAADGTVTAVSKGSATVTAEANGSKYNCSVRCVW